MRGAVEVYVSVVRTVVVLRRFDRFLEHWGKFEEFDGAIWMWEVP